MHVHCLHTSLCKQWTLPHLCTYMCKQSSSGQSKGVPTYSASFKDSRRTVSVDSSLSISLMTFSTMDSSNPLEALEGRTVGSGMWHMPQQPWSSNPNTFLMGVPQLIQTPIRGPAYTPTYLGTRKVGCGQTSTEEQVKSAAYLLQSALLVGARK